MAPARVTYTAQSAHPRIFYKASDVAGLQARITSDNGPNDWKSWWETSLKPFVDVDYTPSPGQLWPNAWFLKMLGHCVAYSLTGTVGYATRAAVYAAHVANNVSTSGTSIHDKREAVLGLASVFDICYPALTAQNKTDIGNGIITWIDAMEFSADDAIDGYTRNHQACALIGALALNGESGFTSQATTRLDKAIDFWYGGNPAVTTNGNAAMDLPRFYSADGGGGQGPWYGLLSTWGTFLLMNALHHGMQSMTLDGDAYTPFTDENWVNDYGLWWLHVGLRGDGEYFRFGDTLRQNNPVFKQEHRLTSAILANHGNWKRQMHWYWNVWQTKATALGQGRSYERALCFILLDKANPATAPLAPSDTPNMPKFHLFQNAGVGSYVSNWDKAQGTQFLLHYPRYYYRGHLDLEVGAIQACRRNDMVVLNRGYYHTTPANAPEDYGGAHNNGWQKQTISKSGVILCDDGSATPHSNYNEAGNYTAYRSGEGGQYWKTFNSGAVKDPENIANMTGQGGGLAWLRTHGRTTATGPEKIHEDSSIVLLFADARRAYHKEYTEHNGGSERLRKCQFIDMIIKDQGPGGILFRVVRTESRLASMLKQQPWHFWGNPLLGGFTGSGQFGAIGYNADGGQAPGAQAVVCYYKPQDWSLEQIGGGTKTAYGATQFQYSGVSFAPGNQPNTDRHKQDIGRFRVAVRPRTQTTVNDFVLWVAPLDVNLPTPAAVWLDLPDFYGLRFPDGKVYQISKTTLDFISPGTAVDTSPPGAVTLSASTPSSGSVQLTLDPLVGDSTMNGGKYQIFRRVKI